MSKEASIDKHEAEMLDVFPSEKHLRTGKDSRMPPIKHRDINLKSHLGRLRIPKDKGRNKKPPTKLSKPKQRQPE